MSKDYLDGVSGRNLKFKKETLLNYGMNRWGLNKAASVGATSELIRSCSPETYEEWEAFYFDTATQWKEINKSNHEKFQKDFGGKVFYIISVKQGEKKAIANIEVVLSRCKCPNLRYIESLF